MTKGKLVGAHQRLVVQKVVLSGFPLFLPLLSLSPLLLLHLPRLGPLPPLELPGLKKHTHTKKGMFGSYKAKLKSLVLFHSVPKKTVRARESKREQERARG